MMTEPYKKVKSLAAYIDRIGAEQLNFYRFIVREYKGNYYKERVIIKLTKAGEITCHSKQYAPTEEEVKAILEEVPKHSSKWPDYIQAKNMNAFSKYCKAKKEDLWEFYDRATGKIIMVQPRCLNKKINKKYYVPWAMFSDGSWLQMEPDCKLPLWKPKKKTKNKIMIHEGGKCGRYADWLCNN